MAYIDNKIEFLSKSISAMSSLADDFVLDVDSQTTDLDIGFELLTCNYMQQQSSDSALSEEQQANALTVLVNNLDLNNVPASLTYALPVSYVAASTVVISHNDQTTGKQGGSSILDEFFHLTLAQVQKLNQVNLNPLFSDIGGDPLANASLNSLFSGKQASINTGSAGQFYAWDKTMRQVLFSNLGSVPTTLAGYGISAGDTLFDNRYIQAANPITGYTIGANAILTNADTWIGSLGKLQSQISNRENYLGLPAVNGYVLSSTTAGVRSWVPFAGGGTVNSVAIASTNGFAGSSVTAAGVSTVTLRTSVTGILKGNGTAISAATPMTDYLDTTGAANGDTILYTGGVATWSPGLVNPMTLLGDLIIGGASGATTRLAGNTTTTRKFLMSVGASGAALAQTYETLLAGDIPAIDISQVTNLQNTLDGYLPDALANNMIFIGNSISNVAVNAIVAGDLTAVYVDNSGTNEAQFTIANEAVTYAKIQNVTSQAILGRFALLDGEVQQLSLSTDFVINSSTGEIGLASPNPPLLTAKGDILTRTGAATVRLGIGGSATFFMADPAATTGNKWVAMSGDATIAVSGALTIAAGAVTLGKMANLAANSFIGNNTGSAATPIALTATQATAMLNLFSTSATTKGLVPGSNSVGATYYLDATGNWSVPAGGGGGGSGTVTSVSVVSANGFAGTVATDTTTPAITLTTTVTGLLKGNGTAISAATAGTDYLTSVGLTMPSAFTVTTSPLTANGTLAVTGAGTTSQYVRGDGTLGIFPSTGGGGGGTVYYLNGNTSQGSIGGTTMYQLSTAAGTGAAANFTRSTTGAIASFITDVGQPNQTTIPAGIWIFEAYLSESGGGANHAEINAVVETWNGTSITVISTGPIEEITNGSTKDLYQFAVTIPTGTTISASDRIVVQINISNANGKTVTLYTEDSNVSSVTTTFANGISSLNGLTAATQLFGAVGTTGTAPAWTSTTATHTLNIPLASASSVTAGLISKTDYDSFAGKLANVLTTTGDIIYSSSGTTAARLGIGTTGQVLSVSAGGLPVWTSAGSGVADGNYGQVNVTGSGTVWTPVNVDGSNFASATALTIFANTTGGLAQPTFATGTDVTALLDVFIGTSGVATRKGLVPAPILVTDVGKFLRADGTWQTVSGSGDMVLATPQRNTGAKTFAPASLIVQQGGVGTLGTILASNATVSNKTATFQDANGTVPFLGLAQTWTASQTFNTNTLGFRNAANTATTTIAGGASAADYTLTIPTLTANTSFAVLNLAQTFTAAQTVQISSATTLSPVLNVNNTSTSSAGQQIGVSVTLSGTYSPPGLGKIAFYAVGTDTSIAFGNVQNNAVWFNLTSGSQASFLLSASYNVGIGLQFRDGYYFSSGNLVTGMPTRSATNYYYSHYSEVRPDAGAAITVAAATDPIYTQYTRIATAGSPINSFNTRVPAANPYVGSMIEVWPSVSAASTLQTGARISTAQYSQTFSTNVSALFSTLIGHWNEYFTSQGSSPTTFTSLIQHALWHQNSSNSTSGNVVGLKIYRTVGTQTLLTKAGIYIDNQTSTASVTNPRTQAAFTNVPTFTNAPWSIFVENDKANFGGGILINPSATLTTVLTATAALEVVSTTKGVRFPNMTTAQKNAIANTAGLVIFDTDLAKLCVNSGSGWQTITSV